MKIDYLISNILLQIGIPHHISGSKYLTSAIKIAMEDNSAVGAVTKKIYPQIAEENNTKPANIERSIRHAIISAWNRNKIIKINQLFNVEIFSDMEKPSNSELIALIAERFPYYAKSVGASV